MYAVPAGHSPARHLFFCKPLASSSIEGHPFAPLTYGYCNRSRPNRRSRCRNHSLSVWGVNADKSRKEQKPSVFEHALAALAFVGYAGTEVHFSLIWHCVPLTEHSPWPEQAFAHSAQVRVVRLATRVQRRSKGQLQRDMVPVSR